MRVCMFVASMVPVGLYLGFVLGRPVVLLVLLALIGH